MLKEHIDSDTLHACPADTNGPIKNQQHGLTAQTVTITKPIQCLECQLSSHSTTKNEYAISAHMKLVQVTDEYPSEEQFDDIVIDHTSDNIKMLQATAIDGEQGICSLL